MSEWIHDSMNKQRRIQLAKDVKSGIYGQIQELSDAGYDEEEIETYLLGWYSEVSPWLLNFADLCIRRFFADDR